MHSRPLDEKYPRKAGVIFAPGTLRHALCARPIAWALLGCTTLIAHRAQGDTQAASAPATASVPAPAGTSDETSLSDIIVTATRRAERLQDVPIAISAFSGSQVEQAQIESSADLQYLVPSLKYQPFGANGSPAFFIRGVGTQTYDLAVERSVGAVLDDVPQLLPRIDFMASLVDLDQVEVLRGPQGTLFGKNSTAGVVSISTKRPELGVFSNEAQIDYGKFDQARFHDIVNIPVGDNIAIRLRASYKTEDAASYNVYISRRDNPDVDYNVNAKILWAPTDNLRVLLEADYQKDFQTTGTGAVPRTQNAQDNPQKFPISYYDGLYGIVGSFVPENVDYLNEIAVQQPWGESPFFAANISYQFGDYSLTSITGYRYVYWNDNIYYDDLPLRYLAFNHNIYDASQVTQEIRLASPSGRPIEYVVGAFFSRFDGSYTDYAGGTAGLLPNSDPIDLSLSPGPGKKLETVVSKSYAVFADVTGHVTDKFQLRLGGRETKDSQSANIITSQVPGLCQITYAFGAPCYPDPGPAPEAGSINHTDWSGRFTAQYDFTEDMMVYATASRGYKAAAITTNSGDLNQIKPETVVDYEAGSKLSLLDRRMRFNVALFHEKFKDFQAQAYNSATPPTFTYTNAGALESEGFEAELTVNPIEHLTLGASTALAKTKYDSYFPSCYILIQGTAACNGPAFGATAGTFNAAGLPLANSPKWTVNLTESYDAPLNRDLNFFVTTDYAYRTSAEFQVGDPGTTQPAFGLMNGSAGIRSSNDSWRVGVWVKNLFDKNFLVNIYDGFFEFPQYLQEPTLDARRSFGLSLTVKFGGGPIH